MNQQKSFSSILSFSKYYDIKVFFKLYKKETVRELIFFFWRKNYLDNDFFHYSSLKTV